MDTGTMRLDHTGIGVVIVAGRVRSRSGDDDGPWDLTIVYRDHRGDRRAVRLVTPPSWRGDIGRGDLVVTAGYPAVDTTGVLRIWPTAPILVLPADAARDLVDQARMLVARNAAGQGRRRR